MIVELEQLTRDYFEDDTHSHLDYALAMLRSGETIASLSRIVAKAAHEPISREMLTKYLHSFPTCNEQLAEAMPDQAQAMIEEGVAIVDEKPADKLAVSWALAKARQRDSYARMVNPAFNPNRGPQVNIHNNLGLLHLMAIAPERFPNANIAETVKPAQFAAFGAAYDRRTPHPHTRSIEQPDRQVGALLASPAPAVGASDSNDNQRDNAVTATETAA